MNELNNVVKVNGTYNNSEAVLMSDISTVNMIDGLILTKEAKKTGGAEL